MKKILKYFTSIALILAIIVLFLIAYFKITAPEGSAILQHYCFGNGEDIEIKSDYLPFSPVIINKLKKMKVGQDERIVFKQNEDWRLSYALNPFHLVKKKNGFEIYQFIKFDTKGVDKTTINLHFFKFKVKDSWVHLLKPTPFMARYKFKKI
jgi:hypothetical protein